LLSQTELNDLKKFITGESPDGIRKFSQEENWAIDAITHDGERIVIYLVEIATSKRLAVEIQLSDFPDRAKRSGSSLSQRVFDMTIALTKFGHTAEFGDLQHGEMVRVSRSDTYYG
jgi:hypothetical protein